MNAEWIPLLQTLIWVSLIIGLVFIFWEKISIILNAIVQRIVAGAEFALGPLNIGSPPPAVRNSEEQASATAEGASGVEAPKSVEDILKRHRFPSGFTEEIYLVHTAQILTPRTERRRGLYRIRVWVEAFDRKHLNNITRVTYRLHETFKSKQIISTESRENEFELWLNVYGEFTIIAYVEMKDKSSFWLSRYLDLPGRPPE